MLKSRFSLTDSPSYRNKLRQEGFTLAEALITLGIAGVITAMTIPALMTNIRKHKVETALPKAMSTLAQALKLSERDNGSISGLDTSISQENFIKQYIVPYMKVTETCKPITKCGYKSQTPWKSLNGAKGYANPNNGGRTPFLGADGILYAISFYPKDSGYIKDDNNNAILIDINGASLPNIFGKDVFILYRRTDIDEISTYGYDKTDDEVNASCSAAGNGLYCATAIVRNGWKIPKSFPF